MKVSFHDRRAIQLGSIEPGQVAIGIDKNGERSVFTKVHVWQDGKPLFTMLLDLNRLDSQYNDKINGSQLVRLLEKGESIEITQ